MQQQQQMHHVQQSQQVHLNRPSSRSNLSQMSHLQAGSSNNINQQQQSPLVQMNAGPGSVPSLSINSIPQQPQQQSSGGQGSVSSQQPSHPQRNTPINYQGSPAVVQQTGGPNSVTNSVNLQPFTPSNRSSKSNCIL